MATVCLVGATGLVGSNIYKILSKSPQIKTVYAYSRKELPISEKLKPIISKDSATWAARYPKDASILISALGTSRAAGGGLAGQRKIDLDLNYELAKAAKEAGTTSHVLISSGAANSSSWISYFELKGAVEDAIKSLDFDHTVLVRPGLLVGDRESHSGRLSELALKKVANLAGSISYSLKDFWAQDVDVIAKAAVRAALDSSEGKQSEKARLVQQADVVRMGRTEYRDD